MTTITQRRLLSALLAVLLAVLAGQLAWVASEAEIGWEVLADEAFQATRGWVDCRRPSIVNAGVTRQANFWRTEVDRILATDPESAELAMGAAWTINAPAEGFPPDWGPEPDLLPFVAEADSPLDDGPHPLVDLVEGRFAQGIDKLLDPQRRSGADVFEARFGQERLDLAAKATRLDPNDVRWWRARALLQFRGPNRERPASADLGAVLDEAGPRDPDNALYDYLRAIQHWSKSFTQVPGQPPYQYEITDVEEFDRGRRCFEAGQAKKFLAFGSANLPAVAAFLDRSKLRSDDKVLVVLRQELPIYQMLLTGDLWRWQNARAQMNEQVGDLTGALALQRGNLQLLEQLKSADEPATWSDVIVLTSHRSRTLESIRHILRDEAVNAADDDERSEVERQADEAKRDNGLAINLSVPWIDQQAPKATRGGLIAVWTLATAALFLAVGTIGGLAACGLACKGQELRGLGAARHVESWCVAFGASFVVFGLCPAEIVGLRVQSWVIFTLAVLTIVGALFWVCITRRFRFRGSFVFRSTVCSCIVAFVAFVTLWVQWCYEQRHKFPPDLGVPPLHLGRNGPQWLQFTLDITDHSWGWAAVQWLGYGGPFIGAWFALGLVGAWFLARANKLPHKPGATAWRDDWRSRLAGCLACVSRSARALGVLCLLAYLVVSPGHLRADTQYRYFMDRLRDPQQEWQAIRAALSMARTDQGLETPAN